MPSAGKTFLLVEDSEDDVFLFKRALGQAQLANPIVQVPTGSDAVLYLTGEGRYSNRVQFPFPSIMFLDLGLPHIKGFDVLESVRGHYPRRELLIVVLTGAQDLATVRRAYALGADSFFAKPPGVRDFLNLKSGFPDHF